MNFIFVPTGISIPPAKWKDMSVSVLDALSSVVTPNTVIIGVSHSDQETASPAPPPTKGVKAASIGKSYFAVPPIVMVLHEHS